MVLGARTIAALVVTALLTAAVPVQGQSAPPLPGLGMDQSSVKGLQDMGAPPVYGSYWVGHWMSVHGWGGLDNALASAKATGVTPVIYWYYWGDSITPSCVENGCDGKSMSAWVSMTDTLASKVRQHMGGAPVIIVLENEFNKGGITDAWYAPKFDAHLEARAETLKAVPGVHVSLGYGSWGEDAWGRFPRAIAASDSIGFQLMRASTRDSEASYRGSDDKIASVLNHIKSLSGKSAFLYDVALSSYPEDRYRTIQAETLASIMDRRAEYAQNGLVGLVYRELRDNPSMGTHNYFGIAEQYWGFKDTKGVNKPAWDVWMKAATGGSSPPPPPPPPPSPIPAKAVPGSVEAETMKASTGGRNPESAASAGATWNLWTNGDLAQAVTSEGGAYRVTVVARGAPAAGVTPTMELRVDGATKATWSVPAGLRAYAADVTLPEGDATLSVRFTNDALVNGEDRNLFVDLVRVEAPAVDQPPTARLATGMSDLTLTADASASSDPEGSPLTYAWSFGDGATATGAKATHAYAAPGDYVVTLRVSDGAHASTATATVTATAPNRAPTATFSVGGSDLTYSFDARASSDPDGDALTYAWSFGDGATATGPTATHAYDAAGERVVTLTVRDGEASATATKTVTATMPNRAPAASVRATGGGLDWTLDASASSDPDGDALQHLWTLPDGTTVGGPTLTRTWPAGDHMVRLQVVDGRGGSADATHTVQARAPSVARMMEAESFATREVGARFADSAASGGAGWLLWSNAALRQPFSPGAGTYQVQVVAKGDMADGAPVMELRADGALVARWTVSSTTWTTYAANVAFQAGETRVLSVHFTNDHRTASADRNLRVDALRLATPSVTAEAEAFDAKDNGARFADGTASGGNAWLLWSNGAMREAVAPGAATWRVEVVAKGDPAAGWPTMELRADGALVARWSVATSQWQTYAADVAFGSGSKTLSVHFVNDHRSADGDRNLRVDVLRLAPK